MKSPWSLEMWKKWGHWMLGLQSSSWANFRNQRVQKIAGYRQFKAHLTELINRFQRTENPQFAFESLDLFLDIYIRHTIWLIRPSSFPSRGHQQLSRIKTWTLSNILSFWSLKACSWSNRNNKNMLGWIWTR